MTQSTDKQLLIKPSTNAAKKTSTKLAASAASVIQSPLISGGQSSVEAGSVSSSWALTVSDYLLQRRAQTHSAYKGQLQPSPPVSTALAKADNTSQDYLFTAIFALLVQRLEEGHTVLVLNAETDNASVNTAAISDDLQDRQTSFDSLYLWQQQLMQPLLQPLLSQAQGSFASELVSVDLLMQSDSELWVKTVLQSTLPKYEVQILQQHYQVCLGLYKQLQQLAHYSDSSKNSLSRFIDILSQQALFSQAKKEIDRPIVWQVQSRLDDDPIQVTLWLHRTWQAEYALADNIMRIKQQQVPALPITLNASLNLEQQQAIHMANQSAFSIITGGPGTGKTFTVAQLVIALQQAQLSDPTRAGDSNKANLALAAPTGKAAQRMQESLQDAIQQAGIQMQLPEAKTIHRLLGIGQGGQPRYNSDNPLSEDIIIVDEASMLGVELANHLVSAVKPNARLILLGDANQLAAVDAGAVLADLCQLPALQEVSQRLTLSRRFTDDSGIGQLARLINQDDKNMQEVWQLINNNQALSFHHLRRQAESQDEQQQLPISIHTKNSLSSYEFLNILTQNYENYINKSKKSLKKAQLAKSVPNDSIREDFNDLMASLNDFRILTAGHHGHCGDHNINHYLSEQHKFKLKLPLSKSSWYHGRPIMILQNNYELGLFNGDIGICMQTQAGQLQVFFENKAQGIAINMFSDEMIATAYAMTIHKSQGSEFEHVAISFDDSNGRLLSQELIYTAVTRAKQKISIFSTSSAFTHALNTPTVRQTGLGLQFEKIQTTN